MTRAAPATVSGEPALQRATGARRPREGGERGDDPRAGRPATALPALPVVNACGRGVLRRVTVSRATAPAVSAARPSGGRQGRDMNTKLTAILSTAIVLAATPALAHHPLGGMPMTTFTHGVLSGIGHPLLGFDHLFFIVAMGVAAALTGARYLAPLAYVAAMLAGVGLILVGVELPLVEPAIALSLLILGGLLAMGGGLSLPLAAALFAVAGLFHGWAFGESLAGQEGGAAPAVTIGYLLGLAAVQYAIAVVAGLAVTALGRAASAADMAPRLAGATVMGVGAFLTLEVVEGMAFAALGIGG